MNYQGGVSWQIRRWEVVSRIQGERSCGFAVGDNGIVTGIPNDMGIIISQYKDAVIQQPVFQWISQGTFFVRGSIGVFPQTVW